MMEQCDYKKYVNRFDRNSNVNRFSHVRQVDWDHILSAVVLLIWAMPEGLNHAGISDSTSWMREEAFLQGVSFPLVVMLPESSLYWHMRKSAYSSVLHWSVSPVNGYWTLYRLQCRSLWGDFCLCLCGYRWFSILLAVGVVTHSIPGRHSSLPTGAIATDVTAESVLQLLWTHRAFEWQAG